MATRTQPFPVTFVVSAPRVVAAAAAVLGIHALDDAFVNLEPGAQAGDHVAGFVAAVAVAALTAWAYPRLRPGVRGTLAIVVGLTAGGAAAAVYGARLFEEGLYGDGYTGLAAAAAGAVLAGAGARDLWRSRKGGRWYLRRPALAVAWVVGAFLVLFPAAMGIVSTHMPRGDTTPVDFGERVTVGASDGVQIVGWYTPSRNGAAVLVYPSRSRLEQAEMLARNGYGVLLLEQRGRGESEGDPNAFGWRGTRDVAGGVDFLRKRVGDRVGAIGYSVGGEVMLTAAAEGVPLAAVVSEGAGIRTLGDHLSIPDSGRWASVLATATMTASTSVFSGTAPPEPLEDLMARIDAPAFLVYADPGNGGEGELNPVYAAAGDDVELWRAPGGHTGAYDAAPGEYERRVVAFFDRTL